MMRGSLMMIFLAATVSVAQPTPAPPNAPKSIRLAPQSTSKQVGVFRYRLLPDPLDRTPGNAAPLCRLAGDAYGDASVKHKMTTQERDWAGQTPLKDLPRKEVRELLGRYGAALNLARQAACRERCDWEMPPLTLQSIEELPMDMIQRCRQLATLFGIQCRLQLVEGRFEAAVETLQTGFALARHLCESDPLIHNLVAMAIAAIMFGHVEEWVQTPGSPNLYWALTALPRPFGDVRRCFEQELNIFYRSFPRLRRLRWETLTARQAEVLMKEVFDRLSKHAMGNPKEAEGFRKVGELIRKAEQYPQARQHLLDLGRPAHEIDAMPKVQVVLLWHLDQYDRTRDDVLKSLTVPIWQAMHPVGRAEIADERCNPILTWPAPVLFKSPIAFKARIANVRLDRQLAGLRGAEALRLYAAAHKGKVPARWREITTVPLPIDPVTGKGFDDFYHVMDGRVILEVPAPPGAPAIIGCRYELTQPIGFKKDR